MPKLSAFPKAFMNALCKDGSMKVSEWIQLASKLDIQGIEWYAGFLEMADESNWPRFRREVEETGKVIPMMCCSPDFTHPDRAFRDKEIVKQKRWIDMTQVLGGSYCRVLSGQRRPELSVSEGIKLAAESIEACLPYAQARNITLIIENHYKDDFWEYPEFAQKADVFCQLVESIHHPNFGVNYDPSNTYLAVKIPLSCSSESRIVSSRCMPVIDTSKKEPSKTSDEKKRSNGIREAPQPWRDRQGTQ